MPYHYNQSNKVSCAFKRELFFGCFCTMKTPAYYINVLYSIQKGCVNALFFEYNIEFSHYILTTENRAFFSNNINSFRHHLIIKYFCNKKVLFIGANPVKKTRTISGVNQRIFWKCCGMSIETRRSKKSDTLD